MAGDRQIAKWSDQRSRLEKYAAAEIAGHDKDGRIDSPFHRRDRGLKSAARRNLFRGGEAEGRGRFLHQQPWRWCPAPAQNPRAIVCQPQHPAGIAAGLHDERRGSGFRQFRLRNGRMRSMKVISAVFSAILVFAACNRNVMTGPKLTLDNYNQITTGMSKAQVEKILDPPTSMETKDMLIFKKTIWRYEDGQKFAQITFKNDEVDGKDTNLGTQ